MKKALSLLFFNLLCLMGFSQSNIRLNNYWENTYYINPASIYSEYQYTLSSAARLQWIGFPGAPNTGFFTATFRPYPRRHTQIGQFGSKVYYDEIGYTKFFNISISYSYSVRLKKDLLMNLGTSGNFQNTAYDMTKSNLETIGDPGIYNTKDNDWNFNPDIGVEFIGKSFLIGLAGQNLISMYSSDNILQSNTNFLYFQIKTKDRKPVNFQYGICGIQNVNLSQLELNISSLFNISDHPDLFQLGVSYRTRKEIGFSFSTDLGQLGRNTSNSCRLALRYDYNFSDIRRSSFGTPEILLIWKFGVLLDCKCRELFK